jgi:hypothetical protein
MRTNTTLSLLRDRKVALGAALQLHSFQASRMLAAQGFVETRAVRPVAALTLLRPFTSGMMLV